LPKKLFERVIASGNHLLTQVNDNQPSLRRQLELGAAGRKPSGSTKSEAKGRDRWETREVTVFPAKAWFRHTPWAPLIKTVLRLERRVCRRDPATGLCKQTTEIVFWVFGIGERNSISSKRASSAPTEREVHQTCIKANYPRRITAPFSSYT
jgi:hypothetical protein